MAKIIRIRKTIEGARYTRMRSKILMDRIDFCLIGNLSPGSKEQRSLNWHLVMKTLLKLQRYSQQNYSNKSLGPKYQRVLRALTKA